MTYKSKPVEQKLPEKIEYGTSTFKLIVNPIKYTDMYKEEKNNTYRAMKDAKGKHGIYIFATSTKVLYVGDAHKQDLYNRIPQHFTDGNSGGCRKKLSNPEKMTLKKSNVYIYAPEDGEEIEKLEIKYVESYCIGKYRPLFNFKSELAE